MAMRLRARGMALSDHSDDSVLNNLMPPTRKKGKMAIAIPIIPTPPIQFKSERQSKISLGNLSNPDMTEEPVVVMPDTPSKIASAILKWWRMSKKGIALKKEVPNQAQAVIKNTWRGCKNSRLALRVSSSNPIPERLVITADVTKAIWLRESSLMDSTSGISINSARIFNIAPRINRAGAKSFMLALIGEKSAGILGCIWGGAKVVSGGVRCL